MNLNELLVNEKRPWVFDQYGMNLDTFDKIFSTDNIPLPKNWLHFKKSEFEWLKLTPMSIAVLGKTIGENIVINYFSQFDQHCRKTVKPEPGDMKYKGVFWEIKTSMLHFVSKECWGFNSNQIRDPEYSDKPGPEKIMLFTIFPEYLRLYETDYKTITRRSAQPSQSGHSQCTIPQMDLKTSGYELVVGEELVLDDPLSKIQQLGFFNFGGQNENIIT